MQCAAAHSDLPVVVSLNALNDIFVHRRTDLTNIAGQSRTDPEAQFPGQNQPANNRELRIRACLAVEFDRPGEYPLKELGEGLKLTIQAA